MNERINLVGDMRQKVLQALIYAGWYSGRKVDIINKNYLYIKKILNPKTPSTEPFRIYSIYERKCWGDYTLSKEVLLSHMNKKN